MTIAPIVFFCQYLVTDGNFCYWRLDSCAGIARRVNFCLSRAAAGSSAEREAFIRSFFVKLPEISPGVIDGIRYL